jgi:hypothetical protein
MEKLCQNLIPFSPLKIEHLGWLWGDYDKEVLNVVPANRNQMSLYQDTKAGLKSLIQQTAQVFVGFIIMLLVTGGNPSGLVVGLSFCLGVGFVAWSEKNRLEEINSSLDIESDYFKELFESNDYQEIINQLSEFYIKMLSREQELIEPLIEIEAQYRTTYNKSGRVLLKAPRYDAAKFSIQTKEELTYALDAIFERLMKRLKDIDEEKNPIYRQFFQNRLKKDINDCMELQNQLIDKFKRLIRPLA